MMCYVSQNNFLISEQQLKRELSSMILAYLSQKKKIKIIINIKQRLNIGIDLKINARVIKF